MPLLGIFATRTPLRPNPIGLTLVEILNIEENILTVRGLDAFDGTPILDIKPFDYWDIREDIKVPDWWRNLEKKQSFYRLESKPELAAKQLFFYSEALIWSHIDGEATFDLKVLLSQQSGLIVSALEM